MAGGLAIVLAVTLWRRLFTQLCAARPDVASSCAVAGERYFCSAVAGLSAALRDPILRMDRQKALPPLDTPGAIDRSITQANIDVTICRPGYARSARPPYAVTGPIKRRLMDANHPGARLADYELDHLIPISLGGAPLDMRDLWLQPRHGMANADDKNALAYVLWRLVCEHRLPLKTAQADISRDWMKAYDTYATPQNLGRYRFRHSNEKRN